MYKSSAIRYISINRKYLEFEDNWITKYDNKLYDKFANEYDILQFKEIQNYRSAYSTVEINKTLAQNIDALSTNKFVNITDIRKMKLKKLNEK